MPDLNAGSSFRVRKDDFFAVVLNALVTCTIGGRARIVYDDGSHDDLILPTTSLNVGTNGVYSNNRVNGPGQLTNLFIYTSNTVPKALYAQAYVSNGEDIAPANVAGLVAQGYLEGFRSLVLGTNEPLDRFGATYVFQGTVAEDATGGTHICTLTVTPGAGNEFQLNYGLIQVGNTATAQTPQASITDGTNVIGWPYNPLGISGTTASVTRPFPQASNVEANATAFILPVPITVSGTMQLILKVTTAAVSVTQTFAVVLQIGKSIPTFTLADTVGTPTLTTNTSAVFG